MTLFGSPTVHAVSTCFCTQPYLQSNDEKTFLLYYYPSLIFLVALHNAVELIIEGPKDLMGLAEKVV